MQIKNNLRIKYVRDEADTDEEDSRANTDKGTFKKWESRKINSKQGAVALTKNNNYPVTIEQFEANAIMLGYYPKVRWAEKTMEVGDEIHCVEPMYGFEIHRFYNVAGVPYSAIYVDGKEVLSCERNREMQMLEYWYNR